MVRQVGIGGRRQFGTRLQASSEKLDVPTPEITAGSCCYRVQDRFIYVMQSVGVFCVVIYFIRLYDPCAMWLGFLRTTWLTKNSLAQVVKGASRSTGCGEHVSMACTSSRQWQ